MEDDAMPTAKRPSISDLPGDDAYLADLDRPPAVDPTRSPTMPLQPMPQSFIAPSSTLIVPEPELMVPASLAAGSFPAWPVEPDERAVPPPESPMVEPVWPPPATSQFAPAAAPVAPPPWLFGSMPGPAGFSTSRHHTPEEDEMADIQWEYCRVQLDSGMYSQKPTVGRYPYFVRIFIDYYGADVPPTATFGEDTDQTDRPSKLWGRIMGQMGLANWEMINIYPGSNKDLSLVNVMAYFKRPVQPGRRVDEPKIVL